MITPSVIACVVFGMCGLLAAGAVEYLLSALADNAGVNRWIFIAVPALFAMFYALILYQGLGRKLLSLRESISRGILIALLTWASFSFMASLVWCSSEDFGQCFSHALLASAIVGGGPMLAAALVGGALVGVLIVRTRPRAAQTL
jgi:hypothetical protein